MSGPVLCLYSCFCLCLCFPFTLPSHAAQAPSPRRHPGQSPWYPAVDLFCSLSHPTRSPSTMTDQYLQEQHALTIARTVQRERELAQARLDSDHGDSWVMITQTGDINPLPHEHIRHRSNAKISLDLSVPKALQQGRTPFTQKSSDGTVYITTQRVRNSRWLPRYGAG